MEFKKTWQCFAKAAEKAAKGVRRSAGIDTIAHAAMVGGVQALVSRLGKDASDGFVRQYYWQMRDLCFMIGEEVLNE
jgi:hypothetical protein